MGKKKRKSSYILNLIDKVNELDDKFQEFVVHIPGRGEMIEEHYHVHLIDFGRPSIQCCWNNDGRVRYGIWDAGKKRYKWLNVWTG